MKIEKVTKADAARLLEIYAPYIADMAVSFEYEVPSLEEFEGRIQSISEKYPYIKAVDEDGTIVGYAYAGVFKGRTAYDWSVETTVYVDTTKRRDGVGSALYEVLEKQLVEMGIQNMNACIAAPKCEDDPYLSPDSLLFHEKYGFVPVGTFHDCAYKFGRWYDMVWMEKMIGAHEAEPMPVEFGKHNR